jgi:uncharacterized OB-fold protein
MAQEPAAERIPVVEGLIVESESGPALAGGRCPHCGYVTVPARPACPACHQRREPEPAAVGRTATLESFTLSHVAPTGISAPYVQAFVRLAEGPKLFTQLDIDPSEVSNLETDQLLELVVDTIGRDEQGRELVGWKYRVPNGGKQ